MIFPINKSNKNEHYTILKTPAAFVTDEELKEFQEFIKVLTETCISLPNCVGLAANQVWIKPDEAPPAIFVARILTDRSKCIVCVNPQITKYWGSRKKVTEGCLSKSRESRLWRYDRVNITFLDETGTEHKESHMHFGAQVLQHEYDHLQGILI